MDKIILTIYLVLLLTPTIMAIIYRRKDWQTVLFITFFNIYLSPLFVWIILKREEYID